MLICTSSLFFFNPVLLPLATCVHHSMRRLQPDIHNNLRYAVCFIIQKQGVCEVCPPFKLLSVVRAELQLQKGYEKFNTRNLGQQKKNSLS